MDLKQLEYFVRVAELGSFTRAAHALQIAQPALSRQVRLLEVELRQTLLLRNGRGAVPTEAGKLLLDHGRGILHQVERAREDLGRVRGALAGRVAIGLPPTLARVLTVPLTRAFRRQLPEAHLSISEGLSSATQEGLVNGRLDLAVLYNAQPMPEIDLQPLFDEELVLVQARTPGLQEDPPPPPIALADVARLPLVIPTRPNAIRMQVETDMATIGQRPQHRAGNRWGVGHPGPGGRRHGQRPAVTQRGQQLDPAFRLPRAGGVRPTAAHPVGGGHQLTTPHHPHPAGHAEAAEPDGGAPSAGLRGQRRPALASGLCRHALRPAAPAPRAARRV